VTRAVKLLTIMGVRLSPHTSSQQFALQASKMSVEGFY